MPKKPLPSPLKVGAQGVAEAAKLPGIGLGVISERWGWNSGEFRYGGNGALRQDSLISE
ncbi:MAG: hypothetical protein JNJ83_09995 [Verrucomicrobiaceae bacterium]|nr:hypothetical protein [Verrucomicrobiaceae bacterium]